MLVLGNQPLTYKNLNDVEEKKRRIRQSSVWKHPFVAILKVRSLCVGCESGSPNCKCFVG